MTSINVPLQRITSGALKELPETFDPAWLRSTWSGQHGRLGLSADITDVNSRAALTDRHLSAYADVGGEIRLPGGGPVGDVNREVELSANGRLNVYHAYLSIDESVQRSGFAKGFNEAAFERYRAAGVDDVTVSAALSAGGYVWARTGFELATEGVTNAHSAAVSRAAMIRELVQEARLDGKINGSELRQLEPRLLGHGDELHPDTLTSIRELAAMDGIGERVLAGQSWSGIRVLDTPAPWSARGAGGGVDAHAGAAHLRSQDVVPPGMEQARAGIASLLPDALEPRAFAEAMEQATASGRLGLVREEGGARASIDLAEPEITTTNSFEVIDRQTGEAVGDYGIERNVADDGVRAWADGYVPDMPGSQAMERRIAAALRQMGVETT